MTKRTARNCAACGKDLYRKKVWEKRGKKVIGYCCAVTYTFRLDGSVRRRDDPNILVAPKVESNLTLLAADRLDAPAKRTHGYWNCPQHIVGENNLSTSWEKVDCPHCLVVGGQVSPFVTSGS